MRSLLLALALLNPVERLDWGVARAVQAGRHPWLEPAMHAASRWAGPPLVAGGLAVVLTVDLVQGAGFGTAGAALVAVLGANLVVEGLKRAVGRVRPDGDRKRSNSSFPSGHAATAFALAWVLTRRWRRLGPAFFLLALLVSYSRLYLNRHFLSDVVAGAVIGLLVAWLVARRWPAPKRRLAAAPP